jgi:hypothetical protein
MTDLTLPIVGITTMIGYFFSKSARTKDMHTKNTVEDFDKQTGENIYTSNKVEQVNNEVLQRSLANYKAAEIPSQTGVIPPLFNTYSSIGNENAISPYSTIFDEKQNDTHRTNNTLSTDETSIADRPMFKYLGFENENEGSEVSLLTGLPLEREHNNMTPFFGSNVKQNTETFANVPLLDKYTGNKDTYQPKREQGQFFQNKEENIYGAPVFTNTINTDRYIPSVFKQNEKPFNDEKIVRPIAGTIDNNVLPKFKDVNELRVSNKPKTTYKGVMIPGQQGEVRGAQGTFDKNRPDTFYEKTSDHLFRTTGEFIANKSMENFETNFKPTSRKDYNIEYIGPSKNINNKARQRLQTCGPQDATECNYEDAIVQPSQRTNYANDYTRNLTGNKSHNDYGKSSVVAYDTERATTETNTHILNTTKPEKGIRIGHQDAPKQTLKQTTLSSNTGTGHVKTTFDQGIAQAKNAGITGIDAKTTHKETTLNSNYKGNIHKQDGMGYLVNKYDARTTGKETLTSRSKYTGNADSANKNSTVYETYQNPIKVRYANHVLDYKGNANSSNKDIMSRYNFQNAEIRDVKEQSILGERPSGPQAFQIPSGRSAFGDVTKDSNDRDRAITKNESFGNLSKNVNEQLIDHAFVHKFLPQSIKTKESIGFHTQTRFDEEHLDKTFDDRLMPDLVIQQHNQNPYSLFGTIKKKI